MPSPSIDVEIFLDLAGIAGVLVDRNADLAVRAGQRPREQAGGAALDVEEADLAEVEQPFVEAGPDIHAAAMDVVGQVIEIKQPGALRAADSSRPAIRTRHRRPSPWRRSDRRNTAGCRRCP